MHDQPLATWARARRMLAAHLLPAVHTDARPLEVTALHVHGEPISAAEAGARAFVAFAVGDAWGAAWDTTWFRLRGSVPEAWAGREAVVRLDLGYMGQTGFGAEGLVFVGDAPVQGLSADHDEIVVARPARGGEAVDLLVEAAANPVVPQQEPTWPLLLPDPGGAPLFRLARAELASVERDVESFCRDLQLVLDLAEQSVAGPRARSAQLTDALRRACMVVDPENLRESLEAAWLPLREALSATGAPRRHRVVAQAHAHIDTAWLWPLRETRRKCARSFSTVLALMDDHPQLRFACSQVQHYAWMREHYPSLWARIRERVAAGQWEPVGGMWVESDCNIASPESLVRQLLHGKLWLSEELGCDPQVGWLPDSFGFPATLPQILRGAGLPYFVSQKISWNQSDEFPHSTFWWEGLDGSRVLTHFPPAATYNGEASVAELRRCDERFKEHAVAPSSLYLYGLGDGGGGPTRAMVERAARLHDVDGLPRVDAGTSHDFFVQTLAETLEAGAELPVWRGELYLERHRGVFTTQAAVKHGNRVAERLLREAEMWSCLAPDGIASYPQAQLDEAWKLALVQQFHDILPGSSIHAVYEDAALAHAIVHGLALDAIRQATGAISSRVDTRGMVQPAVVFNPASAMRREVVDIGDQLALVEAPGCGYAVADAGAVAPPQHAVRVDERSMENGLLRIEWDDDGLLVGIRDLQAGRDILAAGERANALQLFRDHPTDYDAWEIDRDDLGMPQTIAACDSIDVVQRDPLRGAVRIVRRAGASRIIQLITLRAESRRVDFHTEVDWRETHRLLKVAFPVAVRASRASFDLGFGHIERTTHENTSWDAAQFEVPAYRFADVSEAGYGVALLGDSKCGYDVRGHVLRLSLLRAPTAPDPVADRGVHRFTYALLPHPGDLVDGDVVAEAEALDVPLRVVAAGVHEGDLPPSAAAVRVDGAHVVVTAVKKAERGDAVVVRICEVAGGRCTVRVTPHRDPGATGAMRCDLLERPQHDLTLRDGGVDVDLTPFQVATLRFASHT